MLEEKWALTFTLQKGNILTMKTYELSYLVSPELSEEEAKAITQKIISFIGEQDKVKNVSPLVKKRLGSPVRDKTIASMGSLNFVANPEKVKEIEKSLRNEPEILRYMILSKKEKKIEQKTIKKLVIKPKLLKKQKKVELKEIDKKLEEILDTD